MELENGFISSCNFFKCSQVFLSIKSGLVDKACPNLIYPGPKSIKQARSFFPTSTLFALKKIKLKNFKIKFIFLLKIFFVN